MWNICKCWPAGHENYDNSPGFNPVVCPQALPSESDILSRHSTESFLENLDFQDSSQHTVVEG